MAGVLGTVSTYYDRHTGLTTFLNLPENSHSYELPAVQAAPHAHTSSGGYDGQFYAQFAVDPLLRDPAIDLAMDNAPYRARRILLSWVAWAVSGGQAARALDAFAWINVAAWLAMAAVLCVWCPPGSPRTFVLWAGALLGHGWLISIRDALTDGPAVLLTALAVLALQRGRPWVSAMVTGLSGLTRETSILAAVMYLRSPGARARGWLAMAGLLALSALPLALWLDYLRSIYRDAVFSGGEHITLPLSGLVWKVRSTFDAVQAGGWTAPHVANVTMLGGLAGQGAALIWCTRRRTELGTAVVAWLKVAWTFGLLALVVHQVVWDGSPGAITRVTLPLAVGVNVILAAAPRAPWWLILSSNLGVVSGIMCLMFGWI